LRFFYSYKPKISIEKKNLEIFGGHLAKFFCEVNLKSLDADFLARHLPAAHASTSRQGRDKWERDKRKEDAER